MLRSDTQISAKKATSTA